MIHPGTELIRGLGDHPERHVGMLEAAEFSTLAAILAGTIRLKPFEGGSAGNQIALALQTRNPKTMNDIVGISTYRHGLTYGNVNFIGCLESTAGIITRVANFPPPLCTGHLNHQAPSRGDRRRYDLAD